MIVMPPCFNAGETVYFFFDTYAAGASITITGLAVTDIECYKSGSTTQRSSDNGYALLDTDGIDFDGSTGLHGFSIDTSDNSDSGFWADGNQYVVHINAITVDSQTVKLSFLLPLGYLLRPTTAGRKLDVSSGGEAGIDWANVGSPSSSLDLSGTTINLTNTLTTYTGNTPQTGDSYAIVNSGTHGNAALETLVDDLPTNAELATALTAYGALTQAKAAKYFAIALRYDPTLPTDLATEFGEINADFGSGTGTYGQAASQQNILEQFAPINSLVTLIGTPSDLDGSGPTIAGNAIDIYANLGGSAPTASEIADEVESRTLTAHALDWYDYDDDSYRAWSLETKNIPDILKTMLEYSTDHWRYVASALEQGPIGGDATEANQDTIIAMLTAVQGATFDTSTDSLEAIRNRGDAAWITATGFSTLDAAGVRGAVGLATANLDTQLGTLATSSALASLVTTVGVAGAGLTSVPKTGYKLASDGLDSVATTAPTGVAANFREMVVQTWRRLFKRTVYDATAETIKTYRDDGTTVVTTQTATNASGVQDIGGAT